MGNQYNEIEKVWHGPSLKQNFPNHGLGQVILNKLKETDPKRVLEVEHESGASLTAGEILWQTITVAQNLMRLGINRGDIFIIYSKSNIKITPITFALYTIGAPVNFFYLDLKGDDIKYYFEKLDPAVILYEEEFKTDVTEALENIQLTNLKHVLSIDSSMESVDQILFQPCMNEIINFQPPEIENPNELAAVLPFTSGSTGMPKIAIQSHSMILVGCFNKWDEMKSGNVICALSDLRWMCEIGVMLLPVFYDVKRIYSSKREKDFDNSYECELLHHHKVTHYVSVPILHLQLLENVVKSNNCNKLEHLKVIWLGGEVVTDSLIEQSAKIIPNCKIIGCYAMTEVHGKIASDETAPGRTVNGGNLEHDFLAKIVDEEGNNLGPNEKGRLCLKSKISILGYFRNDRANKDRLSGDNGWFKTDECAFMDSHGFLNVVGRYSYLLRYKGTFVTPTTIEDKLNNQAKVLTSALIGFPDPECTHSDIGVVFVVLKEQTKLENMTNELLDLLRKNCTSLEKELVQYLKIIDEMPLCNYCKINRTVLAEIAANEFKTYLKI